MLLEISTTAPDAADLGYLLHKNPANVYEAHLAYGTARVFFSEATGERCTAVLMLDLDQVRLVRSDSSIGLSQYVNDRPYVASSFLSVAIGQAFGSALKGRSKERPERAGEAWPLTLTLPALDCDGGLKFLHAVFDPLGYTVAAERLPLDDHFPDWGASSIYRVILTASIRVADALAHLYVLLPVLDNQKHYFVSADEVGKLLDNAGPWLAEHPLRDVITRRYLRYRRQYVEDATAALDRLVSTNDESPQEGEGEGDGNPASEEAITAAQDKEDSLEQPIRLHDQRLAAVAEALKANLPTATRVIDLGCGEGKLMRLLVKDPQWRAIVGMDVSTAALKIAARRLHLDKEDGNPHNRLTLLHGSLLYRDDRLAAFDAAALVEVLEHIEPDRLEFVERVVFGGARPGRVVVTTPNADYNPHWESLPAGKFRHPDHRFEWTRAQFQEWTQRIADSFGYKAQISSIGEEDEGIGAPTQMAVFDRA